MSGFDKSRIVEKTEEELDEFTCVICRDIFNDPVFTNCCRQTYCKACIEKWLTSHNTCPNDRKPLRSSELLNSPKVVINFVNNMKIKCEYQENGCDFHPKIGDFANHLKVCDYRQGRLCNVCGLVCGKESQIHDCIGNLVIRNKSILDEMTRLRNENAKLKQTDTQNLNDLVALARNSLDHYIILMESGISAEEREELLTCGDDIASRISSEITKNIKLSHYKYWQVIVGKSNLVTKGLFCAKIFRAKYLKIDFDEITIIIFALQ